MRGALIYLLLGFCLATNAQKKNLLPDTIQLCAGDTASIEVRQDVAGQQIRWRTPAGFMTDTRRIQAFLPGKYYIRILTSGNVLVNSDSTYLKVLRRPRKVLRDTAFCAGSSVTLDAGNDGMRYQWSNGEKTKRITVNTEGVYRVRINNGKCVLSDTAVVKVYGTTNPVAATEVTFCVSEPVKFVQVRPVAGLEVTWENGTTTYSLPVVREGNYRVTVKHPRCAEVKDSVRVELKACECEIMIPNSFTPNEDGRNDYFFPVLACEYSYYNLTITDRWGYEVFVTNNPAGKWDGRYKGNLCPDDIYVFRIEAIEKGTEKKSVRKGHISLFR